MPLPIERRTFIVSKKATIRMTRKKKTVLLSFMLLGLFIRSANGQVFPGDANNNGEVDHYDILYIGYAYGTVGPARVNASAAFAEQPVAAPWQESFPAGPNYSFADANGSGLIEWGDLSTVFTHYGNQHGVVEPPVLPAGVPGLDPQLEIGPAPIGAFYTAGSRIELPLVLGSLQMPVSSFHGIAFSATYDAALIQDAYFEITAPWLGPQGVFHFQSQEQAGSGALDVAITHYGGAPGSSGFGVIGKLNFIVEDVLVDLLEGYDSIDINLSLDGVMMVDSNFNLAPVVMDSITVRIYNPDQTVSILPAPEREELVVFPNPSTGQVWVRSAEPIQRVRLYNILGQPLGQWQDLGLDLWPLPVYELGISTGAYILEVETSGRLWKEKLIFNHCKR